MPSAQRDKEHTLILDREDRPPSVSALVNNKSTGVTNRNMGHLRAVISQKSSLWGSWSLPRLGAPGLSYSCDVGSGEGAGLLLSL